MSSSATEKRGELLQYPRQPYSEPLSTDRHLNVSVLLASLRTGEKGPGYSEAELRSLMTTTGSAVRMQVSGSSEACGLVESVRLNSEGNLIGTISIDSAGRKEVERLLNMQGMAFLQVVIGRRTSSRGRQDAADRVLRVEIVDGKSDSPEIRASVSAEAQSPSSLVDQIVSKLWPVIQAHEAEQKASLGKSHELFKRWGWL